MDGRLLDYTTSVITTPKTAEPVISCAPVAQVDRATVS
jgi:hypothetical protein